MLHQKHKPFKYILSLKKWIHWIATRWGKNVVVSKMYKRAWKLKNILFLYLMRTFHNFALLIETTWVERVVKPILEKRNSYSSEYWGYLAHFAAPSLKKKKHTEKISHIFPKRRFAYILGRNFPARSPKNKSHPEKKYFFLKITFPKFSDDWWSSHKIKISCMPGWLMIRIMKNFHSRMTSNWA